MERTKGSLYETESSDWKPVLRLVQKEKKWRSFMKIMAMHC